MFGEEVLAEVEGCDLDDESAVMSLVERFVPVRGRSQGGARSAMRVIAVRQILDDDPPQTWRAVQRMRDAGLDREAVLGQLAMAIAGTAIEALSDGERSDPARLVAALDALPLPAADVVGRALKRRSVPSLASRRTSVLIAQSERWGRRRSREPR